MQCGAKNDKNYRVCINETCKQKPVKEELKFLKYTSEHYTDIDPYQSFNHITAKLPAATYMTGEPEFENPNGYHNIIQVLQSIGQRSGIKQYGNGDREWLFVECDGLPCNLIREIVVKVLRCPLCNRSFWRQEVFSEHICSVVKAVESKREFGWLVPIFGLLHL